MEEIQFLQEPSTSPTSPISLDTSAANIVVELMDGSDVNTVDFNRSRDNRKHYEEIKFVFPDKALTQMDGDYQQQCISEDRRALGRKSPSETFKKLKFSIFQPCKELCDICVGAKLGNVSEENMTGTTKGRHWHRKKRKMTKMSQTLSLKSGPWISNCQQKIPSQCKKDDDVMIGKEEEEEEREEEEEELEEEEKEKKEEEEQEKDDEVVV
ncbi:hypothetical protein PoB_003540200 [Plakobranchus ocellatus]|uniref:Uncharacterized protein n=1 Tax=Plakobranchus ocellatus TaxID=259542 RepID=A0AAV4APN4_9GAST|nr:hypothetical protein PoB_003540200 [Plakobranchus ocellatus]